jgi:ribonuclease P protein subunit POP4
VKVTPDIIRYEFIGTEGKIAKSPHAGYVGIRGEVIDETKNTFTIMHEGKAKSVVKSSACFYFKFCD